MKVVVAMVVAGALAGCTSVRLVQREDCWIRQTEKWPNRVTEEIGPCKRQPLPLAQDRLARLTQECVSQADFRWHNRAIAAWSRGEPLPERDSEPGVEACMANASHVVVVENDAMSSRLEELGEDREHLRRYTAQLSDFLGEAAKRPAGTAVATANARGDGNSSTRNDTSTDAKHAIDLAASEQRTVGAPRLMSNGRAAKAKELPDCKPPPPDAPTSVKPVLDEEKATQAAPTNASP